MTASVLTASDSLPSFSNAAGSVRLDPVGAYVRLNWASQPASIGVWRQVLEQALLQIQQHNWHKLLGDQRALPLFSTENQAWILLDWLPRAVRAGLRYGAIVSPQNVMVRLETAAFVRELNTYPLTYRQFPDEDTATKWLLQQE